MLTSVVPGNRQVLCKSNSSTRCIYKYIENTQRLSEKYCLYVCIIPGELNLGWI